MRRRVFWTVIWLLGSAGFGFAAPNWPHWRGPTRNGLSDETNLPLRWSIQENIHWKIALPGRSGSTPIIWGEHIFVTITERERIELWCVNRKTGAVMWKSRAT